MRRGGRRPADDEQYCPEPGTSRLDGATLRPPRRRPVRREPRVRRRPLASGSPRSPTLRVGRREARSARACVLAASSPRWLAGPTSKGAVAGGPTRARTTGRETGRRRRDGDAARPNLDANAARSPRARWIARYPKSPPGKALLRLATFARLLRINCSPQRSFPRLLRILPLRFRIPTERASRRAP